MQETVDAHVRQVKRNNKDCIPPLYIPMLMLFFLSFLIQKCPDLNKYSSDVTNFCLEQPQEAGDCVEDIYPEKSKVLIPQRCLIVCLKDNRCTFLDFDHTKLKCGCACQVSQVNVEEIECTHVSYTYIYISPCLRHSYVRIKTSTPLALLIIQLPVPSMSLLVRMSSILPSRQKTYVQELESAFQSVKRMR